MTNLTVLDISCCNILTDVGFSFISSLTNLTELHMEGCHEISDNGLSFLTSLKKISILVGYGAIDSEAHDSIARLSEMLTAPVACVYAHNDAFYGSHPMAVGPIGYQGSEAAMRLLSESDLILVLGSRLNSFGTTPQYGIDFFPKHAKLIHNSINPLELGSLRPMNVGLLGFGMGIIVSVPTPRLLSCLKFNVVKDCAIPVVGM